MDEVKNYDDAVILYKDKNGLIDAVYKSEDSRLFEMLFKFDICPYASFDKKYIKDIKPLVYKFLLELNLNNRNFPTKTTLEYVINQMGEGDSLLWKNYF